MVIDCQHFTTKVLDFLKHTTNFSLDNYLFQGEKEMITGVEL